MVDNRRSDFHKNLKMTDNMIAFIKTKLQLKLNPKQIVVVNKEYGLFISYETIYLHIRSDKLRGKLLFQHLRRKGKAYQPWIKDKQADKALLKTVSILILVHQL